MKKNYVIIVIMLMVIGFAAVSTTLYLNGSVLISGDETDFNIYYSNTIINDIEDKSIITSAKTINFESTFKSVGDKYEVEYFITNGSSNYDANVSVNCSNGNNYVKVSNSWINSTLINASDTKSGILNLEMIKGYAGETNLNLDIECVINATAIERNVLADNINQNEDETFQAPNYTLLVDYNSNNLPDVGDEIAIGDEEFYVIEVNDTNFFALAKYNLNYGENPKGTATGLQDPDVWGYYAYNGIAHTKVYGGVDFSLNKGWSFNEGQDINIRQFPGEMFDALYSENGYENYIRQTIPNAEISLITKKQIENLINDGEELSYGSISAKADAKGYSWIYLKSSYWTQSSIKGREGVIWVINCGTLTDAANSFPTQKFQGVRPVVKIYTAKDNTIDTFLTDSWSTVMTNLKSGNNNYKVGDVKCVALNGITNSASYSTCPNGEFLVRILNTTPCTDEESKSACGTVLEFYDGVGTSNMNPNGSNVGGWRDSTARTYLNETVYNALPTEIKNAIIPTKVISSHGSDETENFETTDMLYLSSSSEIWGSHYNDTSEGTSRQFDYYINAGVTSSKNGNATTKYKDGEYYPWFTRTAYETSNNYFVTVMDVGNYVWMDSRATFSMNPVFRVK